MTDDRIDFSPLDPTRDGERFDHVVHAIAAAAAPQLRARRFRATTIGQIGTWRRPMLAAAAAIAIVSFTVLTQVGPGPGQTESGGSSEWEIAVAMGVPTEIADWVAGDGNPTAADLLGALEEEIR